MNARVATVEATGILEAQREVFAKLHGSTRLRLRTWTPWCLSSSLIYARGSRFSVAPLGVLPAPTDPGAIRDPRGTR